MDEKSLLKKLQNKDEKALEDIIDLYNAYVTTIVGSLLSSKGTKEDMEEVIADTFIALWETAERIDYEKFSSIKCYSHRFLSESYRACQSMNRRL